ncbi:hypothetical protein A1Q2_08003 [Trichosporon asahii var. asahii CBS 8904]|uniref:CENP-V/GFA domain-containing protein n=1 Tax=Trichosporon asahii var. asahii (strain CBS 8904) TaxID=1220162 RepID=K1VF50_TRIAC|nr:hypothetical protein A1Q2_08003 [Trichosporon asahii var. asahii CBS 8904]
MTRHGSCLCVRPGQRHQGRHRLLLLQLPEDGHGWVSPDDVKVTKGTPKVYQDNSTRSGKPMARSFCGDCGTPLWSDPSATPGVRYLKVGTLEDPHSVDLKMELFVDKAIPSTVHPQKGQTQLDSQMQPVKAN